MDAQSDTKPFLPSFATAGLERGLHGASMTALPWGRKGARGAVGVQPQQQATCVLNRASSDLSGGGGDRSCPGEGLESTLARHPRPARRLCRNFWSAGDYDVAAGRSTRHPQSVRNRMCIHPKFLHSNATSHKWPFGAVAELLDNAVDEIQTGGATQIKVDKVIDKRNGSPALLVQDDGGGMDPDSIRHCMGFGFSEKQSGSSIGQYGNGFKTSTMRLGADVIVFSRCTKGGEATQSIGLLSYTFLIETGQKDVLVPVVDYKCNLFTGKTKRFERHGSDHFSSNLSVLMKWSPFSTEEELMHNFTDIGPHGTKIIVFNLWSNDDGNLELDFDSNPEDIMISGAPNPEEIRNFAKRANENHLANRLRYSLWVYTSILYLRLPEYFKIILRGQEVERHYIAADLIYPECILYKPQTCGRIEAEVVTSIGFLNGTPTISIHGFNIYHKNRLILPFHRVLSSAGSKGRGIAGVLEADFIKPTHDKQDFEKSQLYQKLINRLKDMTNSYWDLHCQKVGYSNAQRSRATAISPAPLAMLPPPPANTVVPKLEGNTPTPAILVAPLASAFPCDDAAPIAFAPPTTPSTPTGCSSSGMQVMQINQTRPPSMAPGADLAASRKRKGPDAVLATSSKKQAALDLDAGKCSMDSSDQVCKYMGERELKEFSFLKLENRMLREECALFETEEKELLAKEQNLRRQIEQAQEEYKRLLNEYVSVSSVNTETR